MIEGPSALVGTAVRAHDVRAGAAVVIAGLCAEHDLVLMEDCCDALGATYGGKMVGGFGDVANLKTIKSVIAQRRDLLLDLQQTVLRGP